MKQSGILSCDFTFDDEADEETVKSEIGTSVVSSSEEVTQPGMSQMLTRQKWKEARKEIYREFDPNAAQRLLPEIEKGQRNHLSKRGRRNSREQKGLPGLSGDYFRRPKSPSSFRLSSGSMEGESAAERLMNLFRIEVQGVYDGKRSTSLSPSPSPFTCTFDMRPRQQVDMSEDVGFVNYDEYPEKEDNRMMGERDACLSARQLQLMAKLYKAFKRADVANDEMPTTDEIRRTFEADAVVHQIFELEMKALDGGKSHQKKQIEAGAGIYRAPGRQTLFGLQKKEAPSLLEKAWSHLWAQWKEKAEQLETGKSKIEKQESAIETCWRETKRILSKLKDFRETRTLTERQLTPKAKIEAMLKRLRDLETEHVFSLSLRAPDSTKIDFPAYCRAFWPFVDSNNLRALSPDRGRCVFDEAQHRLLGPSISQRFVRDGYLGTNLASYEVQLPGHLSIPLTARMEGPSCALAPRNRGGRPAIDFLQDSPREVGDRITTQKQEETTDQLFNGLLTDVKRYRQEERRLVERVAEFNEHRFQYKDRAEPPAELMDLVVGAPDQRHDHLNQLWEELNGNGEFKRRFDSIDLTASHADQPRREAIDRHGPVDLRDCRQAKLYQEPDDKQNAPSDRC